MTLNHTRILELARAHAEDYAAAKILWPGPGIVNRTLMLHAGPSSVRG